MERILITGSNRGLGLGFVKHYLKRGDEVFATCRSPLDATDLQALKRMYENLHILGLDISNDTSITHLADSLLDYTGALDLLINNAGVNNTPNSRGLATITREALVDIVNANAISPLMLTQALLPYLKKGTNPRVVMISSQMGSLDYVRSGNNYGYAMSKVAMNMGARVLASELQSAGIISITTHPGWVQTDMGGANAQITPEESVNGLSALFERITAEDSGKFFRWDGSIHNW